VDLLAVLADQVDRSLIVEHPAGPADEFVLQGDIQRAGHMAAAEGEDRA